MGKREDALPVGKRLCVRGARRLWKAQVQVQGVSQSLGGEQCLPEVQLSPAKRPGCSGPLGTLFKGLRRRLKVEEGVEEQG